MLQAVSILLITGPPASGKNTVGELIAKRSERCAAIDVDTVRQMLVQPWKNPWEADEGLRQQALSVRNTTAIARNFSSEGFDVVISDVISDSILDLYRTELEGLHLFVVLLLPTEDEINARLLSRPDYLSRGEMTPTYDQQARFLGYDERLDNTEMSSEDAANWIIERWTKSRV
jgi:hypothetical protein